MTSLKIRKIGNSLGVVLPADDLARKQMKEGDQVILSHTPSGYRLDVYNSDIAEQVEKGREMARQYKDTFRELSK